MAKTDIGPPNYKNFLPPVIQKNYGKWKYHKILKPGLLTLSIPLIIDLLLSPYFNRILIKRSGFPLINSKSAMNPSSLRIFKIAIFNFDAGISTVSCLTIAALRIRVNISPI